MAKIKVSFEFQSTASIEIDVDEKALPNMVSAGSAAEAYVRASIDVGHGHKLPWHIESDPFAKRGYRPFKREEVYDPDAEVVAAPPASEMSTDELLRQLHNQNAVPNPGPLIPQHERYPTTASDRDEEIVF